MFSSGGNMGDVINLFDNRPVHRLFFEQIREIAAAMVRDNQLIVRLSMTPVQRNPRNRTDIFELTDPETVQSTNHALVGPPPDVARQFWFDLWLPGDESSKIRARFKQGERSGTNLVLKSQIIKKPSSDILLLSENTMLAVYGPGDRGWAAVFAQVNTGSLMVTT